MTGKVKRESERIMIEDGEMEFGRKSRRVAAG